MSVVAMTGHRPERISDVPDVQTFIYIGLRVISPEIVIQGMASGVDLWSAKIAHQNGWPFWCVRPWAGHKPRKADEHDYEMAIKYSSYHGAIHPTLSYPGPWVYQRRNEWMVDRADIVYAIWDGGGGGTANCVAYAQKTDKKILHYNPKTRELNWLDKKSL